MDKLEEVKIPKWMKLDNAGILYPSTMTRKFAAMFRVSITLNEKVDVKILSKALETVIKRIPSFSYKLNYGLFWHYLSYIEDVPIVYEDVSNPLVRFKWKDNKYFMFKVRCYESRISLDVFHALADGMGAITFLLTLTAEYLRLRYGYKVEYNDFILNPKDKPLKEEYEDSFKKYARIEGALDKEKGAYHIKGNNEQRHILNIITGTILIDDIKNKSKEYKCTITELLTSLMIYSYQTIQEKEKSKKKRKKPIKISVPVNLRKIYHTKTLRNFSSYVNVGIESKYGNYSLEEIIEQVKHQMGFYVTEKRLNSKLTGNVKTEKNGIIRLTPMFIKKYILLFANHFLGDRYITSNLSNIGYIDLPEKMNEYVKKMNVLIGRSRGNAGSAGCVSCGKHLYITFSRKIKESEVERLFFNSLVEMGIPVTIESNQRR